MTQLPQVTASQGGAFNPFGRKRRRSIAPVTVSPEALAFQGDLEQILAEPAPRTLFGARAAALMVAVLLVISAVAQVDIVVVGGGRLVPDTPPIVLQPLDRAIIRDIKVKAGDKVVSGQELALLDPTFVEADVSVLSSQKRQIVAQIERLQAEIEGRDFGLSDGSDPQVALQATLYMRRKAQFASRIMAFDEGIREYEANIRTIDNSRSSLAYQLEVARDVEQMRTKLLENQTGSRLQFLDAKQMRLRAEREHEAALNRLEELQHGIKSRKADRQGFIEEWQQRLMEQLVSARADAARIEESLTKASRLHDLSVILAPHDGVVLEVAKRSAGSVIREAEPLITLVPSGVSLIAEVVVKSSEVGYAHVGDEVVLKVDAFPFQRHGMIHGKLRSVSQESFSGAGEDGQAAAPQPRGHAGSGAFHRAQIELTDTTLADLPGGSGLFAGMTLSAEIKVGTRSVLSYFLYPITRGFREGMREL